jgi:aspartyl-tRNA(Asn)/glutamyl-tRNA(Gln) amidotransferase subunit C
MSLTQQDVERIAHLARIELDPAHTEKYLHQLNAIFALAEKMQVIDTKDVLPLSHPVSAHLDSLSLRLREDKITESNQRQSIQSQAPATQDGLYLVPKVIE